MDALEIKRSTSITSAQAVERVNRALKRVLGTRMAFNNTHKNSWPAESQQAIRKYNNTYHRTIDPTTNLADNNPEKAK